MFMLEKHSWQNPRSSVRSCWAEEGRGGRGEAGAQAGRRQLGDVRGTPVHWRTREAPEVRYAIVSQDSRTRSPRLRALGCDLEAPSP